MEKAKDFRFTLKGKEVCTIAREVFGSGVIVCRPRIGGKQATTFFNLGTKESVGNSSLFSFDHPFHDWILRSKSQNGERKFSKPTGQVIHGTELVLGLLVNPGSFQFLLTGLCGGKYNNEDLGCFEFISKNKETMVHHFYPI